MQLEVLRKFFFYSLVLILFTSKSWAFVFNSETEMAANVFAESISFSGDFDPIQNKHLATWDVSLSSMALKYTDTSTNQTTTDHTNEVFGSLGWNLTKRWGIDGGLRLGNDVEQKLSTGGLTVGMTYTYTFEGATPAAAPHSSADEDSEEIENEAHKIFSPWVKVGLEIGSLTYTQRTDGRKRSGLFTGVNENKLIQRAAGISLANRPVDWFSWKLRGMSFTYDRDLSDFLAYLNSNFFLSRVYTGLSNTITDLPQSEGSLKLSFYPADFWDFYFQFSNSKTAVDDSISTSTRTQVNFNWTPEFTTGISLKKSTSSTISDNSLILDIELIF